MKETMNGLMSTVLGTSRRRNININHSRVANFDDDDGGDDITGLQIEQSTNHSFIHSISGPYLGT